jgi:hypothetical protein
MYENLQSEVDAAFPSGEEPLDVTKLGQMEWLNGCMWVCDCWSETGGTDFCYREQQRSTPASTPSPKRLRAHRGQR